MTSVPDRHRIDTLGSFATLKNFPFRVQEKLQAQGKGWVCHHGPCGPGEVLTWALMNSRAAAQGLRMHLRGHRVPFGFTFNEDVIPWVDDVVLHGLLGDCGGLRHCKAKEKP